MFSHVKVAYDADLGAHVFPYRNYRADLGRWMSADPIHFPDGPNQHFYAPVPTMAVDVWGLEEVVTQWITGDYTWTYTWTEKKKISINSSFGLSFPLQWGAPVSVSPGVSWKKIGTVTGEKTEGTQPTEAEPPDGWEWVAETITTVRTEEDAEATYGEEWQVLRETIYYHHGVVHIYDYFRDGAINGTYFWKRQAREI